MSADNAALEAVAQHSRGDTFERGRARIAGFIDMKIDIEIPFRGETEDCIEKRIDILEHATMDAAAGTRHTAKHPTRFRNEIGQSHAIRRTKRIDRHQRNRLKRNPPTPFLARLAKHPPTALCQIRLLRIEMCTDRSDAMGIGATQAKIHALADVGGGPVPVTIIGRRLARTGERTIGILDSRDDMPFIQMRMHIDESRPHLTRFEINRRKRGGRGRP
ncbi:MAG TPA: hypothetical protein VNF99_02560 [Stellaceae bacterium]|nr:hypothetical protein [Stellaceae bacterium]